MKLALKIAVHHALLIIGGWGLSAQTIPNWTDFSGTISQSDSMIIWDASAAGYAADPNDPNTVEITARQYLYGIANDPTWHSDFNAANWVDALEGQTFNWTGAHSFSGNVTIGDVDFTFFKGSGFTQISAGDVVGTIGLTLPASAGTLALTSDINTSNVTAAGALMDSELASEAHVKALDQDVSSGASPTFGGANISSVNAATLGGESSSYFLDRNNHTGSISSGDLPSASTSAAGVVEISTTEEALTGFDSSRALTEAQLYAFLERVQWLPFDDGSWVETASTGTVSFANNSALSLNTGSAASSTPSAYQTLFPSGSAGTRFGFDHSSSISGRLFVIALTANGSFQLVIQDSGWSPPNLTERGYGLRIDGTTLNALGYTSSEQVTQVATGLVAGDEIYYTLKQDGGTVSYRVTINGTEHTGSVATSAVDHGYTSPRIWLAAQNNADASAVHLKVFQPKLMTLNE